MDPQQAPVLKPRSKTTLIVMIIAWCLFVFALVGLIMVYVSANNKAKQQSAAIGSQQEKIEDQQVEIERLKAGIDDSKVVINEMGLQYPKTPANNNLVYIVDTKDKDRPAMYLTSKPLMLAQLNAQRLVPPPQKNACGAAEAPAGTITSYKIDDTLNGQKVADIQSADLRKIGDTYYFYQKAPAVCSFNADVQKEQTTATAEAQNFFKSLEARSQAQ